MSLPEQEAHATRRAWKFLLGLSSGEVSLARAKPVREEARDIVKHFPLGGDLRSAAVKQLGDCPAMRDRERNTRPAPPDSLNIP